MSKPKTKTTEVVAAADNNRRQRRRGCTDFFQWYNDEHHNDGLALFTPADVYFGRVDAVVNMREQALAVAYAAHPERFINGPPRVPRVLINQAGPASVTAEQLIQARDSDVTSLWTPPKSPSPAPINHLPGVNRASSRRGSD